MFASNVREFNECLADFYEDLECQHHLVQKGVHSKAKIPALTLAGFANYLETCLLAHPDQEFHRLEQVVSEVALFADCTTQDGQPEKLPRSIIRSCLPAKYDPRKKRILDLAVEDLLYDLKVQAPGRRHTPPMSLNSDRRGSSGALTQSSHDRPKHMPPKIHRATEDSIIVEEYDSHPPGRKRFTPTALQSIGDESLVEAYERTHHGDWTRHHVGEQQDKIDTGASATTAMVPLRDGGGARLRDAEERGPLSAGSSSSHSPHPFLHSNRVPQRPSLSHHQTHDRPHSHTHTSSSQDQQVGVGLVKANSASGTIPPPPIGPRASSFSFPAPSSPLSARPGCPHSPTKLRGYSIAVPNVAAGMAGGVAAAAGALTSSVTPSSSTAVFRAPSDASSTMVPAQDGAVAGGRGRGVCTPASTSSSNNDPEPASPTTAVLDDHYGSSNGGGGAAPDNNNNSNNSTSLAHNMLVRRNSVDCDRYHHHPSPIPNHYRLSSGSISGSGGGYFGLDGYRNGGSGNYGRSSSTMVNTNTNSTHDVTDKYHQPHSSSSSSSLATIQPRSSGSDRRSDRTSPSRHHTKSQSKRHGSSSSHSHSHNHGGSGNSGGGSSSSKRRSMPPSLSLSQTVPRSHALPTSPSDDGGGSGSGSAGGGIKTVALRQPTVTDVPEGADEEEGVVVLDDDRGPTWGEFFRGQERAGGGSGGGVSHDRGHGHGRGQRGSTASGYHGGY
jgi:hypothetical protein